MSPAERDPAPGLVPVTRAVARQMAPPMPDDSTHKGRRGRVLVVAGASHTPGAALLAGVAALRAGAGVLQIATAESVARQLAVAVPEARVLGSRLPASRRTGCPRATSSSRPWPLGTVERPRR